MVVGKNFLYFLGSDLTGSDDVLVISVRVIFGIPGEQVDVHRQPLRCGILQRSASSCKVRFDFIEG
jgi:hypothetical protein